MSTTTPVLGLTLYDSTTDQAVLFATFRAVWGGTATTSNFYKIDTAVGTIQTNITALQNTRGAIPVNGVFISSNYYEATVASITSYVTGMTILLKLDETSAGTVTLKINALDTKSVTKVNASGTIVNIAGAELSENRYYLLTYDGTQWVWVNAFSGDQIYVTGGASGNVVTVAGDLSLLGTTSPSALLSTTINSASAKTTPVDADLFGLVDSADSNTLKKSTWANIKATLIASWGVLVNGLAAKTTPIGADEIAIADSAASNATKKVALSNLYKGLGTGTQDSTTFLRGDGTYASPISGASTIATKYIIVPSISSNNLVVALKYIDGTDPSSTKVITFRVGGTEYNLTSSMSFTKNAGTNFSNMGSAELNGQNVQVFMYAIGETGASAGLKFGWSRIPSALTMGDFVNTTNNDKYIAGNWTNFNSTDSVTNIGRFQVQLSATPNFFFSIPTQEVLNSPQTETDWLLWIPTRTGFSSVPTSILYQYKIINDTCYIMGRDGADGTSNANTNYLTVPLTADSTTNAAYQFIAACNNNSVTLTTPSYGAIFTPDWATIKIGLDISANFTSWATSNNKRVRTIAGYYRI